VSFSGVDLFLLFQSSPVLTCISQLNADKCHVCHKKSVIKTTENNHFVSFQREICAEATQPGTTTTKIDLPPSKTSSKQQSTERKVQNKKSIK